jgi:hypothetical protein
MRLRFTRSVGYANREIGASLHANHTAGTSLNTRRYGLSKRGDIVDFFRAELNTDGAAFAPVVVDMNGLVVLPDGVFDRPFFFNFELLEKQGFQLAPEPLC